MSFLLIGCGGGNEPVDPSKPSEPTVPTEPSTPSEPTVPSDPSVPSEPTEPSEPTDPSITVIDDHNQTYYFFIDYSHSEKEQALVTIPWYRNKPLGAMPEEIKDISDKDAPDELFPIFLGWSAYSSSVDNSHLWDFEKDSSDKKDAYIFGIWASEDIVDPTVVGYYSAKVNGEPITLTDVKEEGSTDNAVYKINLKENDEIAFMNGLYPLYIAGINGKVQSLKQSSFVAPEETEYTFYINATNEIWITYSHADGHLDLYVKGIGGNWDDQEQYLLTPSDDYYGEITIDIAKNDEFKIADSSWSTEWNYWGYKINGGDMNWRSPGEEGARGPAAGNFHGSGMGYDNFVCDEAGTYLLQVSKADNYVYITKM